MDKLYNPKIESNSQARQSQEEELFEKANQILICYDVESKSPIEVLKVNYNLIIKPGMVIAQIEQFYQSNQSQKPIELEYIFCIDENAAVTSMIVEIGDQKAYGIIKEREEAIKEYNEGIQQQKTMGYSEQNQKFPDIKTVKIGQLQPNQNLKITFEYIHPPKIFLNKFWQVVVRPMVDSNLITVQTLKNTRQNYPNLYAFINKKVNLSLLNKNYSQDINVDIDIDQPIQFVKSPTHQILVEQIQQKINAKNQCITRIKLENTKENHSPEKEFTLLFTTDQINKSKVYLTHSKNDEFQEFKYCATITFVPDFFEISVEDAYQQYIDDLNITSQKGMKAKFIFLIDRSGSMDGERITKAKEALIIFLKSLPPECEFNIVQYDNNYVKMAEDSIPYCQASIEFAINYVNQIQADGGTNIYQVIKEVIYDKQYTNRSDIQLNVFLLTDGEDSPDQIIDLVQKNARAETRFYTLGIGSNCNKFLIKKIAEVGNGKYHFAESEDIDSKVIDLLEDSLSPYLKAVQLSTNVEKIHQIIPDPESLISLKRNEELMIQILFSSKQKSEIFQFELKCFDPFNNKQLNHQIPIDLKDSIENEYFHKFAGHKLIKYYEDAEKFNQPTLQVKCKQQNLSSQDIINHSVQYQILSSKTAFVCEICQNEKKLAEEKKSKIINIAQPERSFSSECDDFPCQFDIMAMEDQEYLQSEYQVDEICLLENCMIQQDCLMQEECLIQQCSISEEPRHINKNQPKCIGENKKSKKLKQHQDNQKLKDADGQEDLNVQNDQDDQDDLDEYGDQHSQDNQDEECVQDSEQDYYQDNKKKKAKLNMDSYEKDQEFKSNKIIAQNEKAQQQTQIKDNLEFNDLVTAAQTDGRFIFNTNLCQFFAKVEKIFQNLTIIQIQTIIALFSLEYKFPEKKQTWKLIYQKGVSFLQSEKLNFNELKKQYFIQFQETYAQ